MKIFRLDHGLTKIVAAPVDNFTNQYSGTIRWSGKRRGEISLRHFHDHKPYFEEIKNNPNADINYIDSSGTYFSNREYEGKINLPDKRDGYTSAFLKNKIGGEMRVTIKFKDGVRKNNMSDNEVFIQHVFDTANKAGEKQKIERHCRGIAWGGAEFFK